MRNLALSVLFGFLAFASLPTLCSADALDKPANPSARAHLKEGNILSKRARWQDAVREYQAGQAAEDKPLFDYNIGQCLRLAGEYEQAILHYERFLDRGKPEGEDLSIVLGFLAEMRAHLANRARTMPPTEPATTTGAYADDSTPQRSSSAVRPLASEREANSHWLTWPTLGVGIAAMATSSYLFLRAHELNSDSNSEPDVTRRDSLRDRAYTRQIVGAVTGISGAVLTATGVVLLLTRHRDATMTVALSGDRILLSGHF